MVTQKDIVAFCRRLGCLVKDDDKIEYIIDIDGNRFRIEDIIKRNRLYEKDRTNGRTDKIP